MLGDPAGVRGFVEAVVGEPDRERVDVPAVLLQQRRHDGRIDAAREKHAHRHVGHHPQPECVDHQRFELFGELIVGALQPIVDAVEDAPVPANDRLAALAQFEPVARLELEDVAVNAARRVDVAVVEVVGQRGAVDLGLPSAIRAERLELGPEPQRLAVPAEIQWLDAQPIANQEQPPALTVSHTAIANMPMKRRTAASHAPRLDRRENQLGVTGARKRRSRRFQLAPQRHGSCRPRRCTPSRTGRSARPSAAGRAPTDRGSKAGDGRALRLQTSTRRRRQVRDDGERRRPSASRAPRQSARSGGAKNPVIPHIARLRPTLLSASALVAATSGRRLPLTRRNRHYSGSDAFVKPGGPTSGRPAATHRRQVGAVGVSRSFDSAHRKNASSARCPPTNKARNSGSGSFLAPRRN